MTGPTFALAVDRPRARRSRPRRAETLQGWSFVLPATAIVVGLSLFPAAWALLLSMQKWNGFTEPTFIGLDNYRAMGEDADLVSAIGHTVLYTALFVPSSVLLGLLLAVVLNRRVLFVGVYRTAIFLPFVVSAAATGILASYLFNPQYGLVNAVLRTMHLPQQGWLEDPHQAMVVIAIMSLWGQAAFTTVLFLAALQDVPVELVEAARIDGANRWQAFWHITFPQLAPVTVFATIWQTIGAVQLFDLVYTTTRGGPLRSTETVVYHLWTSAFRELQLGYASAVAYGLFGATFLISLGVVLYARRSGTSAF